MRILFFGTPAFAVPSLGQLIAAGHDIAGVVTQPDRPRGRGHKVVPGAVKLFAAEAGLRIFQPERLKDAETWQTLADLAPDLGVVAAYGKILPQRLLDVPRLGMVNVHASLLPRWRGAAPVHRAILSGDAVTGVTIMRVVAALDAGPMLEKAAVAIGADETSGELEARLSRVGAALLVGVVARLEQGPVAGAPQDESLVTYATRLDRTLGRLEWNRPAIGVHDAIRGLQPWPQAATLFRGRRVLLRRSTLGAPAGVSEGAPGEVLRVDTRGIEVGTAAGTVRLVELQVEGRAPVDAEAFQRGYHVAPGDRFSALPVSLP